MKTTWVFDLILIAIFGLVSCSAPQLDLDDEPNKLNVVATTTFVGETVQQVGADFIELTFLLTPGENPHTYEPTPREMTMLANADIIFINGIGLAFSSMYISVPGPLRCSLVYSNLLKLLHLTTFSGSTIKDQIFSGDAAISIDFSTLISASFFVN